jgi:hypothetical protein
MRSATTYCVPQLPRQFGEGVSVVFSVLWLQKPYSYFSNGALRRYTHA